MEIGLYASEFNQTVAERDYPQMAGRYFEMAQKLLFVFEQHQS